MSLLRWREEFSIGIADVDQEHRELVELISILQKDLRVGTDTAIIVRALENIYTQIASHFALEEKIMRDMRYPAMAVHQEDHETLLDDLRDIIDQVRDDGVLDETGLTDDLDRWFSDHFRTHDVKLHR